jgi:hypothetical protein
MTGRLPTLLALTRRRWRRWLKVWAQCAATFCLVLILVQHAQPPVPKYYRHQLAARTGTLSFDFFKWELGAIAQKLGFEFAAPQGTLSPEQRHGLVKDYLEALGAARALNQEINQVYSQFEGEEAVRRAAPKEEELARLRAWLDERQDLAEAIMEEQVSSELQAEGFGLWGYVWPPVKVRFTPLPLLLVTSARAEITRAGDVHLKAGIPLTDREMLEETVDLSFEDKRALVTPIGGLSAYPAMILETDSLVWLADTFAHEWAHHLLIVRPLGYHYTDSGEMTSINETTASIIGREIGRRVIERYYPELRDRLPPLPVPPDTPPLTGGEMVWPDEVPPDQFSYNREMRETRLRVDELLANGQVKEAESYMEERRLFFVENGHSIRKLNQAYFAFYGSYATGPSTANPIGGQLEWLRGQSESLRQFVRTVSGISTHQDLMDLLPLPSPSP